MTSRRSWLLGLALGAAISVGSMQDAHAQVPRTFTYQGQLLNNGQPVTGSHTINIRFYTDASGGTMVHEVVATNVSVANGIFNIEVGQNTPLPASLDFTDQYFIGVSIDGGAELSPRTRLHSAPYAINSNAVNGIEASTTPQPNKLLALDGNAKIDPSVLPDATAGVTTVAGVGPDANGNVNIVAGNGIAVATDGTTNTITISSTGNTGGIQTIVVGDGLIGGGQANQDGEVFISLAPNSVDGNMIGNGVITGMKLNALVAGEGLYQDILGNLNVRAGGGLEVTNDQVMISIGGVGSAQIADGSVGAIDIDQSQVQVRVTGTAPAGSFITGINQNGSVTSGTVTVNSTLTRSVVGSDVNLGINLANPNTWTGAQAFNGGATATSLGVTGPTTLTGTVTQSGGQVVIGGNIDANGGLDVTGASTFAGTIAQTGGGQITLSGNVDANNGLDVTGLTTTQGLNNTGAINTGTLTSTGNVTVGDDLFVQNQITSPSAGHTLGTNSTNATVLTINGVADNGVVDEFVVNGDANFTGLVEFNDVTVDVLTANTVNTTNLGGNGGNPINVQEDLNLAGNNVNGGIFSNYTLHNGNIAVGMQLTNNGTIAGGAISNATITGGTINNTIIGNTTPAAGTFTNLTVNNLADIEQLQVNTTSHFDGLSTFGTSPATDGNKVVIDGIVSTPTNTLTADDYELVVNGDAQITGTLFVNNFQANILSAPIIRFDFAEPFTPGGDMTFRLGGVNFDGAGTVGNLINIDNVPGGAYAMTIHNQATTSGIKFTGDPGAGTAIDIDPYATGINIDATVTGINIINAPTSINADNLITTLGNINADGIATIGTAGLTTIGSGPTNEIDANDGTLNTLDNFDAEGTVTAGAGNRVILGTSNTNDIDVNDGTVHSPDGFDMEGALQVGNAGQFNVSTGGAVTTTSTIDAESTVTAGASNMIVIGTDATTNEISAADGTINTPSNWAFGGAVTIAGNLDVAGTGTFGGGASNFVVLGTSATNDIDAHDGIVHTPDAIDAEGTVTAGAGNMIVIGTAGTNEVDAADGTISTLDNITTTGFIDAEGTVTAGTGNMLIIGAAGTNEVDAADGTVNTLDNIDAEGTGTFGTGNMLVVGAAGTNEVDAADGTVNTLDNVDAEGTGTFGTGNMLILSQAGTNEVDAADGTINTLDNIDAEGTVTSGTGNMIVIGTATTNEVDAADGTINTLDNIDAEGTVTSGAGNMIVIGTAVTNEVDAADGTINTLDNIDAEGTGTFGAGNMVVIGTNAATADITAADDVINTTSALNVTDNITNTGNINLATAAGSTSNIGTTAGGAVNITGNPVNVNTTGDLNTNIGNAAGTNSSTTIGVGTNGNLSLVGIDVDATPTHFITMDNVTSPNQVRQTLISGTANEGVSWDAVQGRYELGSEVPNAVPFSATPRYLDIHNSTLNITRNGGNEDVAIFAGGAGGAVTIQGEAGNLNLSHDAGTTTVNGTTIHDGSGMAPAADVLRVINVPAAQDGIDVVAGQGATNGVNVTTSGTGLGTAYNATLTNTGSTNIGYDVTVSGASVNNIGLDVTTSGTGAIGARINGSGVLSSVGATISGVTTGVIVNNLTSTGTGYNVSLTGGLGNQTGVQVSMNGGVSGDNGLSINGIGSGTGASIAMSNSGGTGINVTNVGTGTGIEVGSVTGGGIGVSSSYTGTGTGSAIAGSSISTNPLSAAVRATGAVDGAAAVAIVAGDLKSTATSGNGQTAAGMQFKIADTRTITAAEDVANAGTVTIHNALVKPNSTIIISVQENGVDPVGYVYVSAKNANSFDVTSTATWHTGDTINYMIVNPD